MKFYKLLLPFMAVLVPSVKKEVSAENTFTQKKTPNNTDTIADADNFFEKIGMLKKFVSTVTNNGIQVKYTSHASHTSHSSGTTPQEPTDTSSPSSNCNGCDFNVEDNTYITISNVSNINIDYNNSSLIVSWINPSSQSNFSYRTVKCYQDDILIDSKTIYSATTNTITFSNYIELNHKYLISITTTIKNSSEFLTSKDSSVSIKL